MSHRGFGRRSRGAKRGGRSDDGFTGNQERPAGLKGKEIGLFYAKKNKERKDRVAEFKMSIWIDQKMKMRIEKLLPKIQDDKDHDMFSNEFCSTKGYEQNLIGNMQAAQAGENFLKHIKQEPKMFRNQRIDEEALSALTSKYENRNWNTMKENREKLPAFKYAEDIINLHNNNRVIVISGETGCGKTTQVPQFILDHYIKRGEASLCRIAVTQPRQISAISVAERVCEERCERLGNYIGYSVRLDHRNPCKEGGTLVFCTTGILFRKMRLDPLLNSFSHIIVDEIHERDTLSDFLLGVLKSLLEVRSDLKVILMSATINADLFSQYFNNAPIFHIEGFNYPVEVSYLEDVLEKTQFRFDKSQNTPKSRSQLRRAQLKDDDFKEQIGPYIRKVTHQKKWSANTIRELNKSESEELCPALVESLVDYICRSDKDNGAILIFVDGWDSISKINDEFTNSGKYPSNKFLILPLHSSVPPSSQRQIFSKPKANIRKIIIATNIAETSITINDIVHVIDCGRIKINNYDIRNNIQTLDSEWVSLANAKQREGRAGRVQAGKCYHLFSCFRRDQLDSYKLPEILRTRVDEVILNIKLLKLGKARNFLRRLMDSPKHESVQKSLDRLTALGALSEDENLTPLGYLLAQLPMDVQTGKMILMASIFSCCDPVFSVAAALSYKSPFYTPLGKEKEVDRAKENFADGEKSDHMVIMNAIKSYEEICRHESPKHFCYRNFLSSSTCEKIVNFKTQFSEYLTEMKFLSSSNPWDPAANINSKNIGLVKAIICSGLYPNVARVDGSMNNPRPPLKCSTVEDGKVFIHPSSVNSSECHFEYPYVMYHSKMKTNAINIYDTTMISPSPLLFFGGRLSYNSKLQVCDVDGRVKCRCEVETYEILKRLREKLDDLLSRKIRHPGYTELRSSSNDGKLSADEELLSIIQEVITDEHSA